MTYEYKVVFLQTGTTEALDTWLVGVMQELNALGSQGWEVIQIDYRHGVYYLKRPLPATP